MRNEMKKIVISGGTGSIGRPLVRQLLTDGHEVVVLSRSPHKYQDQFSGAVRYVAWDAQSQGEWTSEVDGADVVINLAAENIGGDNFLPDRWTEKKKKKIIESRQNTSRAVVEAIRRADDKPGLLLQASATGYYGPRGDDVVTEESPPGNDFLASVAVEWEAASAEVEEYGVRRVLMRNHLVLSTKEGALARMIVPFKFFVGGPYGNGKQWFSWIHPEDLVRAICFVIDNEDVAGPVNFVSPNPVTSKQFAKVLGRVMNRPSWIPVPAFAMKILAGEASMLVLKGQRVSSAYLQDSGFQFNYPELEPTLRDLIENDK
jgi:uncharacterized protein (TIGR01777 family)